MYYTQKLPNPLFHAADSQPGRVNCPVGHKRRTIFQLALQTKAFERVIVDEFRPINRYQINRPLMRGNFLALGFFKVISQILRLYVIAFSGTLLFVERVIFGVV